LLDNTRQILAQVEHALADVQRLSRGEIGHLRVGFAGATYFQPLVPAMIREYRSRHPDVVLSPEQSNTPSLLEGLREGRVDAAFIRPPIENAGELDVKLLVREDMMVVLPHTHPLAQSGASVSLSALAAETFILVSRTIGAGLYDAITAACQRAGFIPRLGLEAPQIASIGPLVGAGLRRFDCAALDQPDPDRRSGISADCGRRAKGADQPCMAAPRPVAGCAPIFGRRRADGKELAHR
jgi:DNA-binding transcriptional LysR family regulator